MPDGAVRPRLALRVGVTGHRWREPQHATDERLDPAHADTLRATLRRVLQQIRAAADAVQLAHGTAFTGQSPALSLITALAEGSDQIAAGVAVESDVGYTLDLIVPYDLAAHASPYAPGSAAHDLWTQARARLVLDGLPLADQPRAPGDATVRHEAALVEVNRRLVWNSDLIIAVWDGHPARGEAGTARVVARAHDEGLPVIHIHAADPSRVTIRDAAGSAHPDDDAGIALAAIVQRLVAPPAGDDVAHAIRAFTNEQPPGPLVRGVAARLYSLMLWLLTGGDRDVRVRGVPSAPGVIAPPWSHDDASGAAHARRAALLDPMFRRADYFATAYGARHRATFTTILFLSPVAVVCAWLGSIAAEAHKSWWAVGELGTLALLLLFFARSRHLGFHARWLDYRLLAERFRHHGFLWPLGRTSPVVRVPTHALVTDPRPAWVNWWYRAVTRTLGVPDIALTPSTLVALVGDIRTGLLEAQARYNLITHRLAHRAEHRLHLLPWIPLLCAIGAAATHVIGALVGWHPPKGAERWLTAIGIVGPALSAALHGFASQAAFQEIGIRTDASAQQIGRFLERLSALESRLGEPLASKAVGDLVLDAADVMGEDLAGWRVDYLARPVNPPG